jgi:hypothetical protein
VKVAEPWLIAQIHCYLPANLQYTVLGRNRARVGAAATRHHEDTDVVVPANDLDAIRAVMFGWHPWENIDGAFRLLLPGFAAASLVLVPVRVSVDAWPHL